MVNLSLGVWFKLQILSYLVTHSNLIECLKALVRQRINLQQALFRPKDADLKEICASDRTYR
jgi:hypothetical protein